MKEFRFMMVGVISVICGYRIAFEMLENLGFEYLNDNYWAQVITILVISVLLDAFAAWVYTTGIKDK